MNNTIEKEPSMNLEINDNQSSPNEQVHEDKSASSPMLGVDKSSSHKKEQENMREIHIDDKSASVSVE